MTRRYDRVGDQKVHALTLCGMTHLDFRQRQTHDYSQYFETISALGLGAEAREQAFRRMVFNVLGANCDDHTKNFSFLLSEPSGSWGLAPAYDVTYAYNPAGQWTYQHLMSVNGKFRDIGRDDIMAVADRHLVPRASAVVEEVREAVSQWPEYADEAGLTQAASAAVSESLPRW
jgi:serine/threonine-protein kinase HipA